MWLASAILEKADANQTQVLLFTFATVYLSRMFYHVAIFLVQRKSFVFLTNLFFTHIPMNGSDCCVEPKPILPLTYGGKKD